MTKNDNRSRIEAALGSLLQRENDDAFVIIEEKSTKKFVQFATLAQSSLLLDVPSQTLHGDERQRAEAFFARVVASPRKTHGSDVSYNLRLGNDVGRAADLTLSIFRNVFQFPETFEILITEN